MRIFDIFRKKARKKAQQIRPSASWSWRGGFIRNWLGEKFSGALHYPSKWNLDHYSLRQQSRIAWWDSVETRSLVGRLNDNVINWGLKLESAPIWELIGKASPKTEEERQVWTQDLQARFRLWANSTDADATGRRTFYQLQDFVFSNCLREGEIFSILRYSSAKQKSNPLELQFINPDQVDTPIEKIFQSAAKSRGNRVKDGIEIDSVGREVAYYIQDEDVIPPKFTRVTKYGPKSGRLFVLHPAIIDSVGQVRGISILAPIIHELQKITDYKVAELEAAIINAIMAVWIKPSPTNAASRALAGVTERTTTPTKKNPDGTTPPSFGKIDKPGLMVQTLKAGEELESYDTKRPNVNFETFLNAIKSSLSASLGIPVEVLDMSFNQNYSASRACLILFWNAVEKWRYWFSAEFLNPIFAGWFAGEVDAGRIKAPGYGDSIVISRAWLNCSWTGISRPSIDPLKEVKAVKERTGLGHTTGEREARIYNGSEFSENIERLRVENPDLAEAKKSLGPDIPPPGKNGDGDKDELKEEVAELVLEELRK